MDVSDDDGVRDDSSGGSNRSVTGDDVVAAMLEVTPRAGPLLLSRFAGDKPAWCGESLSLPRTVVSPACLGPQEGKGGSKRAHFCRP